MGRSNTDRLVSALLVSAASAALAGCETGSIHVPPPTSTAPPPPVDVTPTPTPPPLVAPDPPPPPLPTSCVPNCEEVALPEGYIITPPDKEPQRSVHDDEEYRRNWTAAEHMNAHYALKNGWDGKGVLVGVIDDGVNFIGELEGQVDRELSKDFGGVFNSDGSISERVGGAIIGHRGERSTFRFGAATDLRGRDVRVVSSWNIEL